MSGFYTTHEAARLLGVSLPTVVNWVKARRLRAHRTPGGHRRIARADLAAFMLRHGVPLPAELAGAAEERRKALVVADGGSMREGMARQLASAGYAVEQCSPGYAAGAAVARFVPDAVVLAASAADGGETLGALLADREAGEPAVVAVAQADWCEALRARGCREAIARPLGAGALAEAVARALGGPAPKRRRSPR